MAQGTDRVGGDDVTPPPRAQGGSEHPGPGHDAPMVGDLGANRHVATGKAHPLLSHLDDDVAVRRLLDDGIPSAAAENVDRKSTRLNSSHLVISYAVFCLKKKKKQTITR